MATDPLLQRIAAFIFLDLTRYQPVQAALLAGIEQSLLGLHRVVLRGLLCFAPAPGQDGGAIAVADHRESSPSTVSPWMDSCRSPHAFFTRCAACAHRAEAAPFRPESLQGRNRWKVRAFAKLARCV